MPSIIARPAIAGGCVDRQSGIPLHGGMEPFLLRGRSSPHRACTTPGVAAAAGTFRAGEQAGVVWIFPCRYFLAYTVRLNGDVDNVDVFRRKVTD